MKNKKLNLSEISPPIELEIGKRQNVYSQPEIYGELIREVVKTEWKVIKNEVWFFWYWKPEQTVADMKDCGYSGLKVIDAKGKRVKH